MAYFTIQTLRARMGESRFMGLADVDGDGVVGVEDEAMVQQAIDQACSEIDSHVGTRYSVPLEASNITPALLGKVFDCIVYHLSPTGDVQTEAVTKRYEAAIKWARDIGCGKAQLGITAAEPAQRLAAATVTQPTVAVTAGEFSIVNMRGLG